MSVSASLYLFPMTTKRCPECLSETAIRIILYGMPMGEPDYAIYSLGGCCIFDDMPKYECIECGWTGKKTGLAKIALNKATGNLNED
jgi:hypothetical protein